MSSNTNPGKTSGVTNPVAMNMIIFLTYQHNVQNKKKYKQKIE